MTHGEGLMRLGLFSLRKYFSDCVLLSSGLFVMGLEEVTKKSKFLYTLEPFTDIISLKWSALGGQFTEVPTLK